jgi:hypothetical protein
MAVISTALAAGATFASLSAATIVAGVGTGLAVAGSIGQAYASNKAAGQQQKMANIQNSRERKMALRSMRMQQRALEAQGVSSGTGGGSAIAGAMGATASSTAGAIGFQGALLANAQQITNWNNMSTGFGVLSSVGNSLSQNSNMFTKPTTTEPTTTKTAESKLLGPRP